MIGFSNLHSTPRRFLAPNGRGMVWLR